MAVQLDPLESLRRQNYTYVLGSGSIGGDIWEYKQPNELQRSFGQTDPYPVLKEQYREKVDEFGRRSGVRVLPAGSGTKQEMRSLREGAEAAGIDWVEAPVKYTRGKGTSDKDRSGAFYSPSGETLGTIMGTGSYGGFGKGGYGGLLSEMRAEKGKNSYGPQSTGVFTPSGGPYGTKGGTDNRTAGGTDNRTAALERQAEATRMELAQGRMPPQPSIPAATSQPQPPAAIFSQYGTAYTTKRGGDIYDTSNYPRPYDPNYWKNPFSMTSPPQLFPSYSY